MVERFSQGGPHIHPQLLPSSQFAIAGLPRAALPHLMFARVLIFLGSTVTRLAGAEAVAAVASTPAISTATLEAFVAADGVSTASDKQTLPRRSSVETLRRQVSVVFTGKGSFLRSGVPTPRPTPLTIAATAANATAATTARAAAAANKTAVKMAFDPLLCTKNDSYCSDRSETYQFLDCDEDGKNDHACVHEKGSSGFLGTRNGCKDTWPAGGCNTTIPGVVMPSVVVFEGPNNGTEFGASNVLNDNGEKAGSVWLTPAASFFVVDLKGLKPIRGFLLRNLLWRNETKINVIDVVNVPEVSRRYSSLSKKDLARGRGTGGTESQISMLGSPIASWSVENTSHQHEWMQMDLGALMNVSGVVAQGGVKESREFVTKFRATYSTDNVTWKDAPGEQMHCVHCGTPEFQNRFRFNWTVRARYVRLLPLEWYGRIRMRAALLVERLKEQDLVSFSTLFAIETSIDNVTWDVAASGDLRPTPNLVKLASTTNYARFVKFKIFGHGPKGGGLSYFAVLAKATDWFERQNRSSFETVCMPYQPGTPCKGTFEECVNAAKHACEADINCKAFQVPFQVSFNSSLSESQDRLIAWEAGYLLMPCTDVGSKPNPHYLHYSQLEVCTGSMFQLDNGLCQPVNSSECPKWTACSIDAPYRCYQCLDSSSRRERSCTQSEIPCSMNGR
eukprot:TRINITY_DN14959_c4_g1_i1.p1 TRINITY_DN14959_c4_g1~~TRINITY_DN14959_c4_g1_i1.p1  ORF type:complete len:676 (+),score=97.21 TRINITY_DN14959_c4_g1_i1:336-2363(+)